ncbi:NUDIX domain-containing protein [Nocardia sp. 2]|uniref:NUDIX domain-containing protein n=1 Tax=Nocardia acididurans TaxID=2802282 RepID=A0ABS1LY68_9NOCA|nr:NUDIX domain-containing protein [Nocardia acididurans]MBL1072844.1 NUDIX domain-containing protein [Nocardia acididurans]
MRGDGDGWSESPDGTRQWGRFGAAGLLLRAPLIGGGSAVLLQHRAAWSHQGGTWALPGGARDSHETTVHAAVREAEEEAGIVAGSIRVRGSRVTATAPSGWTYTTVIADAADRLRTRGNLESKELAWVPEDEVDGRPLHPGFALAWPALRAVPTNVALDGLADPTAVAAALPRTLDLADRGFVWLQASGNGNGHTARFAAGESGSEQTELAGNVLLLTLEQVLS